ncbi:MAG: diacylglycerol kinase family protein [Candidatus Izemoplasmatales bacterium]|jgi:diacylglycerol kinase family enzyme|nr:diacylglycerol kinase family protein [Candidatus Izemoplasmatales bacterium]MDD4595128.1 diacylglycerol kinase family protein [Candidatus Izemoplasmatales bacterium]
MFLIIHNPLSNNRKSKHTTHRIVRFFQKNNVPFYLRSTLKIENLHDFLQTNPTITDILHCGGDGSINYLINSVDLKTIPQNIYLAQSGSGNDFLRTLKQIEKGMISIGNATTDVKTVKFINGCGIGVDASVCYYVNKDTKKNKMSYFVNAFRAMSKFKPVNMIVTIDGIIHNYDKAYFCAVQNGKYFGGGMKVTPNADPTSEEYQICVAHGLSRNLLSLLFMTIYSGLHTKIKKYVDIFTGKDISIKVSEKCYFQADGEVLEDVSEVHVIRSESREFTAFDRPTVKRIFSNKI